jgi:hypothetical protein
VKTEWVRRGGGMGGGGEGEDGVGEKSGAEWEEGARVKTEWVRKGGGMGGGGEGEDGVDEKWGWNGREEKGGSHRRWQKRVKTPARTTSSCKSPTPPRPKWGKQS